MTLKEGLHSKIPTTQLGLQLCGWYKLEYLCSSYFGGNLGVLPKLQLLQLATEYYQEWDLVALSDYL